MLVEAGNTAPGLIRLALDMAVPEHSRACWVLPSEEVLQQPVALLERYYRQCLLGYG